MTTTENSVSDERDDLCGCGKPGDYMDGSKVSCNKYRRCKLPSQPDPRDAEIARLRDALHLAEAALSDIGDADREPGDDVEWCERRAAKDLHIIRAALAAPQQSSNRSDAARAMVALESLDDCARMDVGVNAKGAYDTLRAFILKHSAVPNLATMTKERGG